MNGKRNMRYKDTSGVKKVSNSEELLNQVKAQVKKITDSQGDDIKKTLDKYKIELKEFGEVSTETKELLLKASQRLEELQGSNDDVNDKLVEINQKLAEVIVGGPRIKTMGEELEEKKSDLKKLVKGVSAEEVLIKADTVRGSVTGNVNAHELSDLGQIATAKLTAYDVFPKIPVAEKNTNGVIGYYDWDAATTVRAADTRAEGAAFPESTAKWVRYTLNIEKIGDTMPVSDEFFEDSDMFAAELNMFLKNNVEIKRNDQIVNGDGSTPNLKGMVTTVGAYTAAASSISDANIYDLIVKVSEDITTTGGAKYSPNVVFMNISDINKMKLKKDANENYIIPPFVSRDGKQVSEMLILEENAITANTLVVGDSRFGRIYEKKGVVMSRGLVDAQFAEDMETLKVKTRLAFLIRNADIGGFKKVTSITADLATLAT